MSELYYLSGVFTSALFFIITNRKEAKLTYDNILMTFIISILSWISVVCIIIFKLQSKPDKWQGRLNKK